MQYEEKQCKRCSAVWFLLQLYAGSEYAGGQTWPGALTNLGKSSQYVTSIAYVLEGSGININNNNNNYRYNFQFLADLVFSICNIHCLDNCNRYIARYISPLKNLFVKHEQLFNCQTKFMHTSTIWVKLQLLHMRS